MALVAAHWLGLFLAVCVGVWIGSFGSGRGNR